MRQISKVAVVFLCILTALLAGTFDGFERGSLLDSGIHNSHGTGYRLVAACYLLLMLASCLLSIRVFFYEKRWTILAAVGSFGLSLYAFYFIVLQKLVTLKVQSGYTKLMGDAVVYDVIIGVLLLGVWGNETFTLLRRNENVAPEVP